MLGAITLLVVALHATEFALSLLCRQAVRVKSRQAWRAAVRHTGLLFQLEAPNGGASLAKATQLPPVSLDKDSGQSESDPEATHGSSPWVSTATESSLPYPQLMQTISSANFAPAAHLTEHYSPPGGKQGLHTKL